MANATLNEIERNLFLINRKINQACKLYQKDKTKINLIAVSKTQTAEKIYQAIDAGCNIGDFELNYGNRFDKYICFDVFQENVNECIENTKHIVSEIDVFKLAVWSESNKNINVYAYEWATNSDNLNQFGNSGNISCIENSSCNCGKKIIKKPNTNTSSKFYF